MKKIFAYGIILMAVSLFVLGCAGQRNTAVSYFWEGKAFKAFLFSLFLLVVLR